MRSVSAAVVFCFAFFLAGCQESEGPATGPEDTRVKASSVSDNADLEAKINGRINDLFPQPEKSEAHKLFDRIKDAVDDEDLLLARDLVSDLISLAASTDLKDPEGEETTAEAYSDLIDLLFEFVGLTPPEVSAELLEQVQDNDDGTVQVAVDGQDNLILTDSAFAGTFIPDEAISEDVVIVIERLTEDEQQTLPSQECLPTDLQQREGCYQFDRIPEGDFDASVEVGVCAESATPEEFQLHKFEAEEADEGVVPLPSIAFPELGCGDFSVAQSPSSPLPWRLATAAWGATGGQLLAWIGPQPLKAIDTGFGGSTTNFSRIGWAKGLDVELVAGDGQTAQPGESVSQDPTVKVRAIHSDQTPLPVVAGTDVTFTVVEGGGTVAGGQSSATVTTSSNGNASVGWTLGNAGTNRLKAVVPSDSVQFTATATQNEIFQANFDDEATGEPPQDPIVGSWSAITSPSGDSIRVQAQRGDLLQQPVVFFDSDVISGSPFLEGTVEGTAPTSGQFIVSWRMLAEQDAAFAAVTVRDGQDRIIAGISFESGSQSGDINAIAAGSETDTNFDWNAGVARSFRVDIDLDNGSVSFAIDGDPITGLQSVSFENTNANSVDEIFFNLGANANQVFAADDIVIAPR